MQFTTSMYGLPSEPTTIHDYLLLISYYPIYLALPNPTHYLLPITSYSLLTTYYFLPATYFPLPTTRYSLLTPYNLLPPSKHPEKLLGLAYKTSI